MDLKHNLRKGLLEQGDYLKQLATKFRHTLPKVWCKEVYLNPVIDISQQREEADKLINMDWFENLPVMSVDVTDVVPTQKFLFFKNLESTREIGDDTGAYLLCKGGKYYVLDGHHRIANRILQGQNTVSGHVFVQ